MVLLFIDEVFFINSNKVFFLVIPFSMNYPLNILCLQCSEFI